MVDGLFSDRGPTTIPRRNLARNHFAVCLKSRFEGHFIGHAPLVGRKRAIIARGDKGEV